MLDRPLKIFRTNVNNRRVVQGPADGILGTHHHPLNRRLTRLATADCPLASTRDPVGLEANTSPSNIVSRVFSSSTLMKNSVPRTAAMAEGVTTSRLLGARLKK